MLQSERTTTFLFADLAGCDRRWMNAPTTSAQALDRYDALFRAAVAANGGHVFKTVSDLCCAGFADPLPAVTAAICIQRALRDGAWTVSPPPRARIAIHSGEAIERGGDYFGPPLNQVSRVLHAAHPGQILVTEAAAARLAPGQPGGLAWRDLGRQTLRDVREPVRIFQVDPAESARDFPPLATDEYDPNNLPAQMTAFIGRTAELGALRGLLARPEVRLVTLTGPGGVGKTRLAVRAALDARDTFPDGRYLVQLAPVNDPGLVARATADALSIRDPGNGTLAAAIAADIGQKRLLLLLDNFEQVTAAAPFVTALLTACPRLNVLVTSRIRLRLSGEQEFEVPPLTMAAHLDAPLAEIEQVDAVRLFVNRARATRPQFALTEANAASLAGICQKLDGLPLAIELAAARSKRIPPERMLDQLDDRFGFLQQGSRDLPPRQQALRSAMDWSFDLLAPAQQTLFQRLGIFVGGFTLEAAEAVLNPPVELGSDATFFDVLDGVSTLVDNSLLQVVTAPNGDPRYVMLETIHAYARERLEESGEMEAMGERHAAWALELAQESRIHGRSADELAWLARLDSEIDNIRASLAWLGAHGSASHHLELAGALWWYWVNRGYLPEGRDHLDRALARTDAATPAAQADALTGAATIAYLQGDWSRAAALFDQALPLMRAAGDARGLVRALNNAGNVALARDELDHATALYDEALAHLRESDDKPVLGIVLSNLGRIARHRGEYDLARARFAEAIAVQDEIGERRGKLTTTANLADLLFDLDQTSEATRLFTEVRTGYEALGDRHSTAYALERLATVAVLRGDSPAAQVAIDEAQAIFDDVGDEDGTAAIMMLRADMLRGLGRPADAASWLLRALDIWLKRDSTAALLPVLVKLATLGNQLGVPERAARLLGAIATLREGAQAASPPRDDREIDRAATASRAALGAATYEAAFASGRILPFDAVIREARLVSLTP